MAGRLTVRATAGAGARARPDRGILSDADRRRPRVRCGAAGCSTSCLLVFLLVVGLGPLLWLAKSAITPTQDTLRMPMALWPHGIDLENLATAWTGSTSTTTS